MQCLVLATSFCFGSTYLTRFEDQGVGIQWDNIWLSQTPGDPMCFAWVMIMMMVGSVLYFLVGWYISNFVNNVKVYVNIESHYLLTDSLGISIRHLQVVYRGGTSRPAVSDLSLDLRDGQVTTLLGQNGAGKTTTIEEMKLDRPRNVHIVVVCSSNVLTGQLLPTSGAVSIYGRMIPEQLPEARKLIGYCPQYNTLFSQQDGFHQRVCYRMTMREHLRFYGSLKGILTKEILEKEIDEMLESMGLQDRQHELACHLSGGLQRRLCVALAFIGGSKLIVLDEPTSSVDPVARRAIWDLILKYRHGRTILLTTHHMDEADLLSDNVAIVHQGRILCSGSPLLLKHRFGCGYQLSLSRQGSDVDSDSGHASSSASTASIHYKDCGSESAISFIQNLIPNALVLEEHSSELVVSLPQRAADGKPHHFSAFFRSLDDALPALGFTSYGLSSTTLEEVSTRHIQIYQTRY
ncbi:hypothetical protein LAZ67_1002952 [Cordylochernes scorpioides]|uniref:ABC transporter domain-containing protein n=1 Tax=Cordylochernes scorpioides TaxID=51811 RepID=A0ABY6JWH9_9ARAC|nr:hypothetical protein LAZ67_1002952 [Cordylochernes scorpioides]